MSMKTLIVEDDTDKLRKITAAIVNVEGVNIGDISHVVDVHTAKLRLAENRYDLLVLDIALPLRIDKDAARDGGIMLLDELMRRERLKMPTHVIGITGFGDVYVNALSRFSQELFTVVRFASDSDDWAIPLQARVRQILAAVSAQRVDVNTDQTELAIVCALDDPELVSVLRLDWSWRRVEVPGDETVYYRGEFSRNGSVAIVHAAAAERMGMVAASILSMKMIANFRPRYLVMPGITAGMRGRVNFGDIIAADPTWDWGSGKWVRRGSEVHFEQSPHQIELSPSVRSRLKAMRGEAAIFSKIRESWPGDKPDHVLQMYVGPLASGAGVLADGATIGNIKDQNRSVLGVEMEAYAVYAAARGAAAPRPDFFSLKSVVDFADGEKDDRFRKYAAYVSAQVLKSFVEGWL